MTASEPPAPPLKILIAAEEAAGQQLLRQLARSGHEIIGVLATPDEAASSAPSVWKLARHLGLDTWPAARVRDPAFVAEFRDRPVDVLLNVHSLHVIRAELLNLPRFGAFNLHPGPLPGYAGLNAPSWAILQGERTHGVTLHRMEPGIDTGPIALQTVFDIEPAETALSLYLKCVRHGLPLVTRLVETLARDPGGLELEPQDPAKRRYFGREAPNGGWLDLDRPLTEVFAFIRAFDFGPFPCPWGRPRLLLNGGALGILKAAPTDEPATLPPGTVVRTASGTALITCSDACLAVSQVESDGRILPADRILRSGDCLITRKIPWVPHPDGLVRPIRPEQ